MSVVEVGSLSVGELNTGASGALAVAAPALAQFEAVLTSPSGMGAVQADVAAQLGASLSVQTQVTAQVTDPVAAIRASLSAATNLVAQLNATLALGVPQAGASLSASLSASQAFSSALQAKLGGIQGLLSAAIAAKVPAVDFFNGLSARLSAGPVTVLSFGEGGGDTLGGVGNQINSLLNAGVTGVSPGDTVYGVLLVTKSPSAWAALQATLRTS